MNAYASFARQLTAIDAADVAPELAARRLGDTVAALLAGRETSEGKRVTQAAGATLATPDNPVALAGAIRHTEIDDIHLATCVTASAIVVPAALGVAAHHAGIDGAKLRRGLAAGYAAAIRFGLDVGGVGMLKSGVWPSLAVAPVAAAATAGVMLELDADALAHALRIAALRTNPRIGRTAERGARWYLFGTAVAAGIGAAGAAGAGLRIDENVALPVALDETRAGAAAGDGGIGALSQKPFCTSRQALSGAIAVLTLFDREGIEAARVAQVRVEVPREYAWQIEGAARPGDRISTPLSQSFQIAAAATDRNVLYDVERSGPFSDALWAFAARVETVPSDAFDDVFPGTWPARVTVRLDDGREHVLRIDHPPGDPEVPLSFEDLRRKSPRYTRELEALCARAAVDGPGALIAALTTP